MSDIRFVQIILALILALQAMVWMDLRSAQAQWLNVPDVPSRAMAPIAGLGDEQLAYRYYALMMQNAGDTGGRTVSLKQYDYQKIADWMVLGGDMDPVSNVMPFLAAYYYSAIQDEAVYKLRPVVEYLAEAGNTVQGEKWRWLAQAVFLARYRLKDTDYALRLAKALKDLDKPGMPVWAKQMPILVLEQKGEKRAALDMALNVLETEGRKMDPHELLFMVDHICNTLMSREEASNFPLCQKPSP